jgi:hypothetical protein
MGRPTKEYQAFTLLVDKLLTVPKDEHTGGVPVGGLRRTPIAARG